MDIISVHVPKTGGTSFRDILMQVHGSDKVILDYDDKPGDPNSLFNADYTNWLRGIDAFIRNLNSNAKVIHGHFSAIKYFGYFHSAKRIIWLREPISRLISTYFFWKNLPVTSNPLHILLLENNLSFLEFAELPERQNMISRLFLKNTDIESFDFVGIQEFFEEDLAKLQAMLNWPKIAIPVANQNRTPEYHNFKLDKPEFNKVTELNKADIELYQKALQLRSRR